LELYRLKADRFPAEMSHRLEMGLRLRALGQLDEAISQFQQARRDPPLAVARAIAIGTLFHPTQTTGAWAQRNFQECLQALPSEEENARKEVLYQLAQGHANAGDLAQAIDIGHELANLDFAYRDIGRLLDEWQSRLQQV
jgi:tetratricopeptide (TPR) repeat protein